MEAVGGDDAAVEEGGLEGRRSEAFVGEEGGGGEVGDEMGEWARDGIEEGGEGCVEGGDGEAEEARGRGV